MSQGARDVPAATPGQPEAGSFSFALTVAGRDAGEQTWTVTSEKFAWVVRVQTDFGGILPVVRRVQTSRVHPRLGSSLSYSEGDGRSRASFETVFDRKAGLVTLRQGREEISDALLTEHHDPVSLLLWLRAFEGDHAQVQMVGGRVHVSRTPDTPVGGLNARTYTLRPGGAVVYVEDAPQRRLLRLVQPTDFGSVEATLQGTPALAQLQRERERDREGGVRARRKR